MIDLSTEQPLNLADLCAQVPPGRNGKRTHLSTLLRWILKGARAVDGSVVKLEGLRLGGRWVSTREALQRFAERLSLRFDTAEVPNPRTPGQRQRASQRAAEELEKAGY
jgi:hypothetical protein